MPKTCYITFHIESNVFQLLELESDKHSPNRVGALLPCCEEKLFRSLFTSCPAFILKMPQMFDLFAPRNEWQYVGALRLRNNDKPQLMYREFVVNDAVLVVLTMVHGQMVH